MIKRYFGKTTPSSAKQPTWTDGKLHKTAIHWKKWAREQGLETELFNKKLTIVNPLKQGEVVIILRRSDKCF